MELPTGKMSKRFPAIYELCTQLRNGNSGKITGNGYVRFVSLVQWLSVLPVRY